MLFWGDWLEKSLNKDDRLVLRRLQGENRIISCKSIFSSPFAAPRNENEHTFAVVIVKFRLFIPLLLLFDAFYIGTTL